MSCRDFSKYSKVSRSVLFVLLTGIFFPVAGQGAAALEIWDAAAFEAEPDALVEAADALEVPEGTDVHVLLQERRFRFDEDGRRVALFRVIFRPLTQAGVEGWSQYSVDWRPWNQERPEIQARVVTPDGAVHHLDLATVAESPVGDDNPDILSDRRQLVAPLPALTVGALVEETAEVRDTEPRFAAGTSSYVSLGGSVPIHRSRLILDVPRGLPLRYAMRLLPGLEPERREDGGRVTLTFAARELEAIEKTEPLRPGDVPARPLVAFSTGESWSEIARQYSATVDAKIGESDLGSVVGEVLEGHESRRDKAVKLLAWLQSKIRYTGLEFSEAEIVPRTPGETLQRGYGDCKDKATLLTALLRQAGLEAYLALLSTGPGLDVDPELPGFGFFDHAIVFSPGPPDEGGDLWIDPTSEFAGVGELPGADAGRLALVAGPETVEFSRTPQARPEDNRIAEVREIFLSRDLDGARVVETSYSLGASGRQLRRTVSRRERSDLEEQFSSYFESVYSAEELLGFEHSDPHDLTTPFELRLEGTGALPNAISLEQAVLTFTPTMLLDRLPELFFEEEDEDEDEPSGEGEITSGSRRSDLLLAEPYVAEHRYRIVPPDGYRPVELPEDEEHRLGAAKLTRQVELEGDTVVLTLRFDTAKGRYSPAEVEELKTRIRELQEEAALRVGFEQTGHAHLAAGRIREALAEFDRLVESSPERALPHLRRSLALLAGGLGEAARQEARKAVELEPDLDLAHQSLAWVLQHDTLGRLRRPGFDLEGAADAYRRAIELEPEEAFPRQNLAILLEHDENGFRYTPGADLDGAIAQYEALDEELEDESFLENHAIALARAGRFEDMTGLSRRLEAAGHPALVLVARAGAEGAESALRQARRMSNAESRRNALTTAGQTLLFLRRYPEAAALLAAAAQGSPNPTEAYALVEMLGKVRLFEEISFDDADPTDTVRRLLIAIFNADRDEISSLLSQQLGGELAEKDWDDLYQGLFVLREALRESAMPIEVVTDLGLASLRMHVDGEEETGHRIRIVSSYGEMFQKLTFFLTREDGAFRVVASEGESEPLGAEALRQLEAGRPEAARQWLDWALDSIEAPAAVDPYGGEPFFHLWRRDGERDDGTIRTAAAVLMTQGPRAEKAATLLEAGLDATRGEARRSCEIALGRAYLKLGRYKDALGLARSWLAERPGSDAAFRTLRAALVGLERRDELETGASERLEALGDDVEALRALAEVARHHGETGMAAGFYRRLVESGKAEAEDYSHLAWARVLLGQTDETTLEQARQGVLRSELPTEEGLRILAVVYAELGRPGEAREILLQAMQAGAYDEPRPADGYVWGLVAESYGVTTAAARAYARAEVSEDSRFTDLAARRLRALEEERTGIGASSP